MFSPSIHQSIKLGIYFMSPNKNCYKDALKHLVWTFLPLEIQLMNHWFIFVTNCITVYIGLLLGCWGVLEDNYLLIISQPLLSVELENEERCWNIQGGWAGNIKCPRWLMLAKLLCRRSSHDQRCPAPLPSKYMMDLFVRISHNSQAVLSTLALAHSRKWHHKYKIITKLKI